MIKLIQLLEQSLNKPKAIFLSGAAGSGKTTIAKQLLPLDKFTTINIDDTYEELLKKSGIGMNQKDFNSDKLSQAAQLMGQARNISKEKLEQSSKEGKNLIIDGTGASFKPIEKKKEELEKLGYETFMIITYVYPTTSLERNSKRERSLLPSIVLRTWSGVNTNISDYKRIFGDNMVIVNNEPENSNKEFNLETIKKQFFDTTLAKGKPKSPEEQEKSDKEKDQITKNIQYLLKTTPEFDSLDVVKQKITKFLK